MLKKLLKHELQATGRYMWIVYLAMVLLSVGGFVLTRVLCKDLLILEDKPILTFILVFGLIIWFVALCAAALLTIIMNVYRFYKNFLTDEGYLMFTLPVSVHQLLWSKILVAALWTSITTLLVFAGLSLGLYNLFSGIAALDPAFAVGDVFGALEMNIPLTVIIMLLVMIVGSAVGPLQFYCVMSIGYGFTKNKALWSIVIYFAIQAGLSVISGAFNVVNMLMNTETLVSEAMYSLSFAQQWYLMMLGSMAVSLLMGAVYYLVTAWNLRKRLNLA